MTLEEWATEITTELRAAGFTVDAYQGFPLVTRPEHFDDGVRLLKWRSPSGLPCAKSIYAEGMLVLPAIRPPARSERAPEATEKACELCD